MTTVSIGKVSIVVNTDSEEAGILINCPNTTPSLNISASAWLCGHSFSLFCSDHCSALFMQVCCKEIEHDGNLVCANLNFCSSCKAGIWILPQLFKTLFHSQCYECYVPCPQSKCRQNLSSFLFIYDHHQTTVAGCLLVRD